MEIQYTLLAFASLLMVLINYLQDREIDRLRKKKRQLERRLGTLTPRQRVNTIRDLIQPARKD